MHAETPSVVLMALRTAIRNPLDRLATIHAQTWIAAGA